MRSTINYNIYIHKSGASAGFRLFLKLIKKNSKRKLQNSRSFPGVQENYLLFQGPGRKSHNSKSFPGPWKKISQFQEISRALEENLTIPGFFQGPGRKSHNSRSFPGPWKKISQFQEFSRNSRSSEHHVITFSFYSN